MRLDASFSPERVGRLRADFLDTDALLILDGKNIRYLTGFSGESRALMAGRDWLTLLVDGRFVTQARDEAAGAEVFEFRKRGEGIAEVARRHGVRSLGFESSVLSVAEHRSLGESLTEVTFLPLPGKFEFLRAVKNGAEIERIRAAAKIAGEALATVREMVRPGVREEQIALELEYRMRLTGASQVSFESIIASGPNSALPHAIPGRREIREGDPVTIDYGAVCDGYHSDETCTFFAGCASDRQREVYRLVLSAHDRAIGAIREGIACGEIDRIARSTLAEAGLDQWFSHGTGHGVGLAVHEAPRLAAGREETLLAGMVVTVEPGVYLPGDWGIRIEDTVLVTQGGCEVLTRTSKDLTVI